MSAENHQASEGRAGPSVSCFVSYNHADKPFARALRAGLEARGYRVWIDEGELGWVTALSQRSARRSAKSIF